MVPRLKGSKGQKPEVKKNITAIGYREIPMEIVALYSEKKMDNKMEWKFSLVFERITTSFAFCLH